MKFFTRYALVLIKFDGFINPFRLPLQMAEYDEVNVDLLHIYCHFCRCDKILCR